MYKYLYTTEVFIYYTGILCNLQYFGKLRDFFYSKTLINSSRPHNIGQGLA